MKVDIFIPYNSHEQVAQTLQSLHESECVNRILLLTAEPISNPPMGCETVVVENLTSTPTLQKIATHASAPYTLLYTQYAPLQLGAFALERTLQVGEATQAGLLYADHYRVREGKIEAHPLIAYQAGSLRDDFELGSLLLFRTDALQEAVATMNHPYRFAALYDLRLKVSQHYTVEHINEYLYTQWEEEHRSNQAKMFDYVDAKNRAVQIEMEEACTHHLHAIGGYLPEPTKHVDFTQETFEVEASVIIPVRNRIRTIGDAIRSVLSQEASFPFNVIVVDNHSTDGTTEAIQAFCNDSRVIHICPSRTDLGIGGCWNMGVADAHCGKFAIQLDSDDVYSSPQTLQQIVDCFYQEQCAMVVGSYQMTDFEMNEIPPGTIDHREWSAANGHNNALRINGLGAPRAFYTPLLRELKLPNTSYGEDYAIGLRIARQYPIGRIYEVLYRCRRWEDNSDASLDIAKLNAHNCYKDRIRTWELQARIALNQKNKAHGECR